MFIKGIMKITFGNSVCLSHLRMIKKILGSSDKCLMLSLPCWEFDGQWWHTDYSGLC